MDIRVWLIEPRAPFVTSRTGQPSSCAKSIVSFAFVSVRVSANGNGSFLGSGAVVTAEEHSVIGGLGAAVCESLSETYPVPVLKVGVEDKFGRSGQVPELLEIYGLTAKRFQELTLCPV